ncbi:MAG: prephenate dehydrogenase/arogenate dehydrogenase family protein [Candidatus Omnitrophica bacterium]|nr:prephenate dehydrogenase/arogenate dehydrogenase family protein [Candidatus Omnitrophota bacterium]
MIGFSRHEATIRRAKARGAIDDGDTELCPDWLGHSDLVVIATPPETVIKIAQKIRDITKPSKASFILTDVASTKNRIVWVLERDLPDRILYAGSHPMAGSEQSGISAAEKGLFEKAACIVTRTSRTPAEAFRTVSKLWESVGGRVVPMTPSRHDRLVAQISHVPHLVSVALARTVDKEALSVSGGGFASVTRLALSDPELWEEIIRMNWSEVNRALGQLIKKLEKLRGEIRRKAFQKLLGEFRQAQLRRQRLRRD